MSNSLILLNLIRASRLAGLWNRSRVASTTNSKVMKSSRKSSIAWAIVSDLPLKSVQQYARVINRFHADGID
ncbi:hypothetical protein NKJ10_27915 [Mesorhizobium sp. M0204]|uniref:hypothetical protein n=1 Tax=Mesorhizobium sp. M0204 TaxID=2956913 RepID=UPI00333BE03D